MRLTRGSRALQRRLLLLETPDEVAISIACALDDPKDLLRLSMACKRYRLRTVAEPACNGSAGAWPPQTWSIVDECARRWLVARPLAQRSWLPRCWEEGQESRLGLMHEVLRLLEPPRFAQAHPVLTICERGAVVKRTTDLHRPPISFETFATCGTLMRAGRHYAQFRMVNTAHMLVGLMRSTVDVSISGIEDISKVQDESCFLSTYDGSRLSPTEGVYPGLHREWEIGDRVGLLLDVDQGSLTVYRNDQRLGIMAVGLSGEFCWAVSLDMDGDCCCIEPAPIPEPVLIVGAAVTWSSSSAEVPTGMVGEIIELMSVGTVLCRFPTMSLCELKLEELFPATMEQAAIQLATKSNLDKHLAELVVGAVVQYIGPVRYRRDRPNDDTITARVVPGVIGEVSAVRHSGMRKVSFLADADVDDGHVYLFRTIYKAQMIICVHMLHIFEWIGRSRYSDFDLEPSELALATAEQQTYWALTKVKLDGKLVMQLATAKVAACKQLENVQAVCLAGSLSQSELNGVYVPAGMHEGWPRFERQVANVSGTAEPFLCTSYHLYYHAPYRMWFLNDAFRPSSDGRLGCIEAIDGQLPIAIKDLRWQFWYSKERLWQRRPLTVSLLRTTDEVIKYRAQSVVAEKAHAAALVVGTVAMTAEHVDKVFSVGIGGEREVEVSGGTLCEIVEVSSDYVGIRTEQVEICGQLYLPQELVLATAEQAAQWAEVKARLDARDARQRAVELPSIRKMFALLDVDNDGVLSKDEYIVYLQALGLWGNGPYTDQDYDELGWADECEQVQCAVDEGITQEAFAKFYKNCVDYRLGMASEDLNDCTHWISMSQMQRQRHLDKSCLRRVNTKQENNACDECEAMIPVGTHMLRCTRCHLDLCEQCSRSRQQSFVR